MNKQTSTHGPVEQEYQRFMRNFGRSVDVMLKELFGPDIGFVFTMFKTESKSRFNYISNCEREDIIELLEEVLKEFKKHKDDEKPK